MIQLKYYVLLLSVLINLDVFGQQISITTKDCDSLKVVSLEYPVSATEIDNFLSTNDQGLIKINLEYNSIDTSFKYISYPVWSILNENGDTLGKNDPYTYTFGFNKNPYNLVPRSKLVVDSEVLAQSARIYIHLHDNFENINSTFACVIPFNQIILGVNDSERTNKEKLSFYPNPAIDLVHFNDIYEKIDLFDDKGKVIFSGQNISQLNVSQFSRGFYTLKMRRKEGQTTFQKLIIE